MKIKNSQYILNEQADRFNIDQENIIHMEILRKILAEVAGANPWNSDEVGKLFNEIDGWDYSEMKDFNMVWNKFSPERLQLLCQIRRHLYTGIGFSGGQLYDKLSSNNYKHPDGTLVRESALASATEEEKIYKLQAWGKMPPSSIFRDNFIEINSEFLGGYINNKKWQKYTPEQDHNYFVKMEKKYGINTNNGINKEFNMKYH